MSVPTRTWSSPSRSTSSRTRWMYSARVRSRSVSRDDLARSALVEQLADQGLNLHTCDWPDHPRRHPVMPIQNQGARDPLLWHQGKLPKQGSVGVDQLRVPRACRCDESCGRRGGVHLVDADETNLFRCQLAFETSKHRGLGPA